MPYIPKITKTPTAAYTVTINFSGWPQLATDNLASASATVSPSGLTLGSVTINATDETAAIPISSGTDGTTYRITCTALTTGGDTLVGYLDVAVSTTQTDGTVVYPSQLLPYFDNSRAMEMLFDSGELAVGTETPSSNTIDGNARAFALTQSAWRAVIEAVTRGKLYSIQELTDYANDPIRGADLIELVANIFWCKLVKRRRYVKGEPQQEEAACEEAEKKLEALRHGERIFNLEGIADSTSGTVRTNLVGETTHLSVGKLGDTDVQDTTRRFWADTPPRRRTWRRGDWLRDY